MANNTQDQPITSVEIRGTILKRWRNKLQIFLVELGTNPITLHEFIRYARSGRFWGLMALLLMSGSSILCMVWSSNFNLDPSLPLGRRLFYAVITCQLVVIFFILPGIVAYSLIREREQDTYPLLLTTPLTAAKIIAGKLISTVGVMALLIISTFPLIGICVARGGVSPLEMVGGILLLLYISFIVASFAIYHALNARSTINAIFMTHITLFIAVVIGGAALAFWVGIVYAAVGVVGNILNWKQSLLQAFPKLYFYTFLTLAVALFSGVTGWLLRNAQSRLRFVESRTRDSWEMNREPGFLFGQRKNPKKRGQKAASWWDYQDGQNPFYVRERLGYAAMRTMAGLSSWYMIIMACHVFFLLTPLSEGRWVAVLVLLAIGQMAPAYAGPLFAREHERGTWGLMQTTVYGVSSILHGKLKAALSHCLPRTAILYFLPFSAAYIFYSLISTFNLASTPLLYIHHIVIYGLILLFHLFFLLISTTYLSIRYAQVSRAISGGYCIALMVYFIPLLIGMFSIYYKLNVPIKYIYSISPIYLLYGIPSVVNSGNFNWLYMIMFHLSFYLWMMGLFYGLCLRRLRRGD